MKIGVVSCSGEDYLGGTISRLATRKMLDEIRPDDTVTICLPLYLAGGEEERGFAQIFPTITVDGCSKQCARRATEKYSGKVSAALDITEVIGKENAGADSLSTKDLTDTHREMIDKVTQKIREKFDNIVIEYNQKMIREIEKSGGNFEGGCGCGSSK